MWNDVVGFRSFRNTRTGSWYLNALTRVFAERSCDTDVAAMLRLVRVWFRCQLTMYYRSGTGKCCCIGRCFMFTHPVAALGCVKWRHGRHLESVTSNRKSDSINRCLFTLRTFLPYLIPIRFETPQEEEEEQQQQQQQQQRQDEYRYEISSWSKNARQWQTMRELQRRTHMSA